MTIQREEKKKRKKKEKREKEMREREEKDDEGKKFLDTINVRAFRSEKSLGKNGQKEEKEIKSLFREVDGYTAKLIKIKIKLWEFRDKIRRVLKGKVGWSEKEKIRTEKFGKLHKSLEIVDYDNWRELERKGEKAKKLENKIARTINKRKNCYKKMEIRGFISEIEKEGWKRSKKFFDKMLKKAKK
jgi:hypothetical protein